MIYLVNETVLGHRSIINESRDVELWSKRHICTSSRCQDWLYNSVCVLAAAGVTKLVELRWLLISFHLVMIVE